ncbi:MULTISPECIES: isopenicillin N synthase family dioxygenase [Dietzia]|uniref:2-oxoglutarate and iron-dependent oxygenase domain-containing protein n=1 Tax=Dietzia cercidiphylli TaxID=498199 RepID=A0ABP4V3S2_9ACTN|nr:MULTISPECIES: isopenicillin N synthase family oxygenase [Dietzia]MBB1042113.1 isopenicillin N synthase family oxygenase [Dietzia sp. Cai40]MBB1042929.1 isopenicillin N synthase family oxygenase [Dietzia sp. DQ11-44]MBB1047298.1 isopenicillin N synthase family oxygenase [Dietzia cercidiphylli]
MTDPHRPSVDFESIPVIDVSTLADPRGPSAECVDRLGEAARGVGFLLIVNHGVADETFRAMHEAAQRFFAQPDSVKREVYIGNSTNHRGYVPIGEEVFAGATPDLKEAYDLSIDLPADHPEYLAGNPLLGPNQWPDLPGFREAVTTYYDEVFALGSRLLAAFARYLDLDPATFLGSVTQPPSQLRLIHYPYNPDAEDRPGIGAHTDYEALTLLKPTAPGLEVMNGRGEWIEVPYREDAIVVNIGDLLEVWTNGAFVATSHRVRKISRERYSYPLFFTVDYDTMVAPLTFPGSNDSTYEPLHAGEHLFAQTAQSFAYLRRRIADGDLALPEGARPLYSLGRETSLVGESR